jgi:hypothetical protein
MDGEVTTKKGGRSEDKTHKKAATLRQSIGLTERQKGFQPFRPYMQTKIDLSKTYRTEANTHYMETAAILTK